MQLRVGIELLWLNQGTYRRQISKSYISTIGAFRTNALSEPQPRSSLHGELCACMYAHLLTRYMAMRFLALLSCYANRPVE